MWCRYCAALANLGSKQISAVLVPNSLLSLQNLDQIQTNAKGDGQVLREMAKWLQQKGTKASLDNKLCIREIGFVVCDEDTSRVLVRTASESVPMFPYC